MNHRHFKLNQVKARIEGRKARDTIVLTKEEAQKVIDSKEWQDFWAKVRAGEIG